MDALCTKMSSHRKTCPPTRAIPELLTCEDRQIFRAHLQRLDKQTRQDRFGNDGLNEGFFERYVQNINFTNTRLIGVFADGTLRASAELRSLHSRWSREAELAIVEEGCWQGLGFRTVLFRNAISCAQELGVTELFISCNLDKDCSVSFLRFLGKELRSTMPPGLTSVDLLATRNKESGSIDGLIRLSLKSRKVLYHRIPGLIKTATDSFLL
jgi:hypothetical protein